MYIQSVVYGQITQAYVYPVRCVWSDYTGICISSPLCMVRLHRYMYIQSVVYGQITQAYVYPVRCIWSDYTGICINDAA